MIYAFILSAPRSGSTLLRLTLNKMPGVIALPETNFFAFIDQHKIKKEFSSPGEKNSSIKKWVRHHSIKKWNVNHAELEKYLEGCVTNAPDLLLQTISFYLKNTLNKEEHGIKIIDKSPTHIFYQHYINDWFPGAKKLFLVRDPRDVVASLKTCSWSTSNPLTNAKVWKNGIKSMNGNDVIKYENLVADPVKEMTSVSRLLDITLDAEKIFKQTEDEVEKRNLTSMNSLKPISTDFINSYKNKLSKTDKDLEIIQEVCKKEMLQLGYTLEPYHKGIKFWFIYLQHTLGLWISKLK